MNCRSMGRKLAILWETESSQKRLVWTERKYTIKFPKVPVAPHFSIYSVGH